MIASLIMFSIAYGAPVGQSSLLAGREDCSPDARSKGAIILDVRSIIEYGKGHLPGAIHADGKSWQKLAASPGGMKNSNGWAKLISSFGIKRNSKVIVYGDPLPEVARVWWLARYAGVADCRILDRGLKGWIEGDGSIEMTGSIPAPSAFTPKFRTELLAETGEVKKNLGKSGFRVIDSRSPAEYSGAEIRGKKGGHIPGATNIEWKELVGPEGSFLSQRELRAIFSRKGVNLEQTVVTC